LFFQKNISKFKHIGFVRCPTSNQNNRFMLAHFFGRQARLCRYLSKNAVLEMLLIVIVAASAI